jgi:hypothetical protein
MHEVEAQLLHAPAAFHGRHGAMNICYIYRLTATPHETE